MKHLIILVIVAMGVHGCEKEPEQEKERASTTKKAALKQSKKKSKDEPAVKVDNEDDARILLVGIWRLDVSSVAPDEEILALPKHEQGPALKDRRSNMRHVAYEFAEDGKLTIFLGGQNAQRGSYEIKKGEKNHLDIEANTVGPIGSKTHRWQVTVNEKALAIRSEKDGQTLRLFRGPPIFKGGD